MARRRSPQSIVNQISARLMPVLLVAVVGYATWVEVVLIGIQYLLQPAPPYPPRTGPAVAVITVYLLLLISMAATYFRTLYVVVTDPGYVPLPPNAHGRKRSSSKRSRGRKSSVGDTEKSPSFGDVPGDGHLDRGAVYTGRIKAPPGLAEYWARNIFECEHDGLPRWCSVCASWKPDRSHHSSEAGRCVYKFDHFCPWLGGVIAEPSFKFFLQFCMYAALFCAFVVITCAYFIAERSKRMGTFDVNWIIILALAAVFFIFTTGMSFNATHAVLINMTMTDKLSRGSRTHFLAVLMPPSENAFPPGNGDTQAERTASFPTIIYPLPDHLPNTTPPSQLRRFAVLPTPGKENPYKFSSRVENYKSVMGDRFIDWILPFRRSPCCSHTQIHDKFGRVMYQLGPVVEGMMKDAGLTSPNRLKTTAVNDLQEPMADNRQLVEGSSPEATEASSAEPKPSRYTPPAVDQVNIQQAPPVESPGSYTTSRLQGYDENG